VDIVLGPSRVAVFVDGCFWHQCPLHATLPKANHAWWQQKLAANVARDRRVEAELTERGEDSDEAAERVAAVVRTKREPATAGGCAER
jgi:DNA mismatch endonuclease (patch repair protein)